MLRIIYLDTCCIVKLYIDEDFSDRINTCFNELQSFWLTEFCFYETLSVFKAKRMRKIISEDGYQKVCRLFISQVNSGKMKIANITLNFKTLDKVESIVDRYGLDFSDALSIGTSK